MEKYTGFAQDASGNLLTTGTVSVYRAGTLTLAAIYTADSLAATATNPLTLGATGKFEFWARNGLYDVRVVSGATDVTVAGVQLDAGVVVDLFANRPAFGSADRVFIATDQRRVYLDTGAAWLEVQAGGIVQTVYQSSTAIDNTTTIIPNDNTAPQSSEGKNLSGINASITPVFADSLVEVDVEVPLASSSAVGVDLVFALFKDSDTAAIRTWKLDAATANLAQSFKASARLSLGDTNSHNLKLYYGPAATGTMYIGGDGASELFGGTAVQFMRLREVRP